MTQRFFTYCTFIALLFFCTNIFGQATKQEQLERRRAELRQELNRIYNLKKNNKAKELSVLDQVEGLNSQIDTRQNLIRITNQQANLLTRKINGNTKKIETYRKELKELKKDYAQMIVKSYKSNSQQSRIMFLLSSKDFLQAYKRLQYMNQYTKYRKKQADHIKDRTDLLQKLNIDLVAQKKRKVQLIDENRVAQTKLNEEKKQQQELVSQIRKKEGEFTKQIRKKQKEADAIDKEIEKLIREAIARANKKAGEKASSTKFALTAEAKALAANFTANKGKLPWPVLTGKVVKKFGKQAHPTIPNITINNSGVEIETKAGEEARAIFKGEVSTIKSIRGAGKLVQIRHGNFITTYYNLEQISVVEGQAVGTKDAIGKVRTNPTNGRAIMKFLIYQNATRLNPQHWIYKM